jgi:hypothetical protein
MSRWLPGAASSSVAICLLLIAVSSALLIDSPDIVQDYQAARNWRLGGSPSQWALADLEACCPGVPPFNHLLHQPHAPVATLMAVPLSYVPWPAARWVWLLLSWVAIVCSWHLTRLPIMLRWSLVPWWTIALGAGGIEPIMALLLAIALQQTRIAPQSLALGTTIALKAYPAALLPALWFARKRRLAITTLAVTLGLSILSELVLGSGTYRAWFQYLPVNTMGWVDRPYNLSLVRAARVLWHGVSPLGVALVCATVVLATLYSQLRRDGDWSSGILIKLLCSPLSWPQYMGLLGLVTAARRGALPLALTGYAMLMVTLGFWAEILTLSSPLNPLRGLGVLVTPIILYIHLRHTYSPQASSHQLQEDRYSRLS